MSKRIKKTIFLWLYSVFIGISIFIYPILPDVERNHKTSSALLLSLLIIAFYLHLVKESSFTKSCILVSGILIGIGLSYGWAISGGVGGGVIAISVPLLLEMKGENA